MLVHLIDGTFELFRHHHSPANDDPERGAVRGVLRSMVWLLERGGPDPGDAATHVAVATDHVIESFRNALWPDYKSSAGVPQELLDQFQPLEDGLRALGLAVWPMVDEEADDGMATGVREALKDPRVTKVVVATPDKDLGQVVDDPRVVQWDRMRNTTRDTAAVHERFGVAPGAIPDWLALVGDSADGFPGIKGFGQKTAATLLDRFGSIDAIPEDPDEWGKGVRGAARLAETLREQRPQAMLFRTLATLVEDVDLGAAGPDLVDQIEWTGPTEDLQAVCDAYDCDDIPGRLAALGTSGAPAADPGEVPL